MRVLLEKVNVSGGILLPALDREGGLRAEDEFHKGGEVGGRIPLEGFSYFPGFLGGGWG